MKNIRKKEQKEEFGINQVKFSLRKLDSWIENNGWAGYDPYDIKGTTICQRLTDWNLDIFFKGITELFPMSSRKILHITPEVNAKAMALFGRGYLKLFSCTHNPLYKEKAEFCLNWLFSHYSPNYSGLCWGYPFDWQSIVFIPKNTPSAVVTSQAAHAFLDAYEIFNDEKYLASAISCSNFFLKDLQIDYQDDGTLCFSYTPIDKFHVHNANFWACSVLIRLGSLTQNDNLISIGKKGFQYSINGQNTDGSWYYWGIPDSHNKIIDNYHTGFNLECLGIAKKYLGLSFQWDNQLKKGIIFYYDHLFMKDGTPKLRNDSIYPIDIHSCAQSIITFSILSSFYPEYDDLTIFLTKWAIENMQDKSGFFYFRKYRFRKNMIPYVRWGQAWMLLALSACINNMERK